MRRLAKTGRTFVPQLPASSALGVMDRWILASTQSLIRFVRTEMQVRLTLDPTPVLTSFRPTASTRWSLASSSSSRTFLTGMCA